MELGEECRTCLVNSQTKKVASYEDKEKVKEFISLITSLANSFPSDKASPLLMREINYIHRKVFNKDLDYSKEKYKFNHICLKYEDQIKQEINKSKEPLKKAIQFARVGNLIDFAKLSTIDESLLDYFIQIAEKQKVEEEVYKDLVSELTKAKKIVYLLDNCGEIVFDKIMIETIQRLFPTIEVVSVVRGQEIINDVTYVDSMVVGLNKVCKVIDNGTDIPGTYLEEISDVLKEEMKTSDLIISKGLGNFETLNGCGLNIYYMFLCKCMYFANKFSLNQWESVLINEKRLKA